MTIRQRPDWDEYFLGICRAVSARSVDVDTQNGAVITNPYRRIVGTGYNAFPAGVDDAFWPAARGEFVKVPHVGIDRVHPFGDDQPPLTASDGILAYRRGWLRDERFYGVDKYYAISHAEENAIAAAGQDLHGCTLYTELFPCHVCARLTITAGVTRVVYRATRETASFAVSKELLIQAGVELCAKEG